MPYRRKRDRFVFLFVSVLGLLFIFLKFQVEQLVNEMKEVNLQSLAVTSTEDIHHLIEGK